MSEQINRRIREMDDDDAKKLEYLVENQEAIKDLLVHRASYAIVSKRIKVVAAWIVGVGTAFFFLHEKIISFIKGIVDSSGGGGV